MVWLTCDLHLGQEAGPGPDHLLAGDERLEAADLQVGVGLPGQAQGLLQVQVGRRGPRPPGMTARAPTAISAARSKRLSF